MLESLDEIREKTKGLSDIDKLALVDSLLGQLDRPDLELDKAWCEEALRRQHAYHEGQLEVYDYEKVIESFQKP